MHHLGEVLYVPDLSGGAYRNRTCYMITVFIRHAKQREEIRTPSFRAMFPDVLPIELLAPQAAYPGLSFSEHVTEWE